jgi:hypothetical protein
MRVIGGGCQRLSSPNAEHGYMGFIARTASVVRLAVDGAVDPPEDP